MDNWADEVDVKYREYVHQVKDNTDGQEAEAADARHSGGSDSSSPEMRSGFVSRMSSQALTRRRSDRKLKGRLNGYKHGVRNKD